MPKRLANQTDLDNAPVLPVALPASAHPSDPISRGKRPEIYSLDGLRKVAVAKHPRTQEFEQRLVGIWWAIGERPVPFIFRTSDGTLRSLDAGCLGFLVNRTNPEVDVDLEEDWVVAVAPIGELAVRYLPIRHRLMSAVIAHR